MTKLGWALMVLILLGIGAVVSFTSFGPANDRPPQAVAPARAPADGRLLVPVQGVTSAALHDTWGQARGEGRRHEAIDIMAPGGTPVIAAATGSVQKLFRSDRGGTTLYVRTDGGAWVHYYAHLSAYAAGMREGQRVRAGEVIGFVGDTGNAGQGNTHLHFAVARMHGGDRWWQGEPVNPYPLLARSAPAR